MMHTVAQMADLNSTVEGAFSCWFLMKRSIQYKGRVLVVLYVYALCPSSVLKRSLKRQAHACEAKCVATPRSGSRLVSRRPRR